MKYCTKKKKKSPCAWFSKLKDEEYAAVKGNAHKSSTVLLTKKVMAGGSSTTTKCDLYTKPLPSSSADTAYNWMGFYLVDRVHRNNKLI